MIFFAPFSYTILIYVAAALLPAIWLMRQIYKLDSYEKEPVSLLLSCIFMGILAAFAAIALESIGQGLLGASSLASDSRDYLLVLAFIVVALSEEGAKFLFLYLRTWKDPHFDYRFDGIVYSAFVSLGFAAFENVKYIFSYGLSVALPRAFLSVPGHLAFAIVFGAFYGRARIAANYGHGFRCRINLFTGLILAVFLHGFYDACAMSSTTKANLIFIAFVAVMYYFIIRLVKRESASNRKTGFHS